MHRFLPLRDAMLRFNDRVHPFYPNPWIIIGLICFSILYISFFECESRDGGETRFCPLRRFPFALPLLNVMRRNTGGFSRAGAAGISPT